jgi:hypothetical protein
MLCKRRLFALAAALSAFAVLSGAQAQLAFVGRTLQFENTSITSVGYDYPGDYGYRRGYRDDGPFGLLEIPFALLGGIGKVLTGGHGEPYYGDSYRYDGSYYPRPFYDSQYYGSPYRDADYGRSYYGSLYDGGSYYFSPRHDRRRYYYERRAYDDRRQFTAREYREYDGYRGYYADRDYDNRRYDDRYHSDAYGAYGYIREPHDRDVYIRSSSFYGAEDDDD